MPPSDPLPPIGEISTPPVTNGRDFRHRAWHGQERLWKVWWLLGIPLNFAARILGPDWNAVLEAKERPAGDAVAGMLIVELLLLGVVLAWMRMAWRCARNVDHDAWTALAKTLILLNILALILFWAFLPIPVLYWMLRTV